ncbi:hypothetical protein [Borrelia puertoricensis]|uniref:hypothetical protein n=1 Tax=Borrelia puertoricensis TaxID=2756107 RepID=UPI001FF565F0|nr:hypothetical protein [Borrelia puertoricensis]UPA19075.1 hypothetical protein bpuSUM_001620 [Borrelia puertoricensis]
MSSGIKRQINIIGTIATTLMLCVSGIGTYALKGFLSDFKKEMMEELHIESEKRLKGEFEALKIFLREDLKRDIERVNSESREMMGELESLLLEERFKIKNAFREELDKCFGLLKNFEEEGMYEK